jgi:glycosyltransferase involved in cell wall biosynthesis
VFAPPFPRLAYGLPEESIGASSTAVQALAADLGNSVRWLGLRRDMPALLDAADGFVLSSAWEGMPLAVGEAMAMEKSVVATDVGGVRELMGDTGCHRSRQEPGGLGRGDAGDDAENGRRAPQTWFGGA